MIPRHCQVLEESAVLRGADAARCAVRLFECGDAGRLARARRRARREPTKSDRVLLSFPFERRGLALRARARLSLSLSLHRREF